MSTEGILFTIEHECVLVVSEVFVLFASKVVESELARAVIVEIGREVVGIKSVIAIGRGTSY